ncbi:MAG: aminopeptidase [Elusimicrobiota bacterium]|jgi:aminopeptidase|nr:aminopeptidase [Elusimicrobiota bacterium]
MDLKKYADVMVYALKAARRGAKFKAGDNILISFDAPALPLAEEIYAKLIAEKFNVVARQTLSEKMQKTFYAKGSDAQLKFQPPWEKVFIENLNGLIAIIAPQDLKNLKDIEPSRIALAALAGKSLRELRNKREEQGLFSWTLCNYPTVEHAKQAGLSLKEYQAQVAKACFLNEKNPVAKFAEVTSELQEIAKTLSSMQIETLRTQSKDMDFEILLGQNRRFISASGNNVPSFEVFTSPDWRGTKGIYYSDLTSFRSGNYVKEIKLEFKAGRVIKASAKQGEKFLKKMLAMDRGAAQIGEYSLTDNRFSKINRFMADTLFDENYGGKFGNSHIALGASFSDAYLGNMAKMTKELKKQLGFNDSALHWDLVNTQDKLVTAKLKNGRRVTIYEKGRFLI